MLFRIVTTMLIVWFMLSQVASAERSIPTGVVQLNINPDTYVELYCNDGARLSATTDGGSVAYVYCAPLEKSK